MSSTYFSKRLKYYREKKGFEQKDIAKALNYSQQTISKWENGIAFPTPLALEKLAQFLEVNINDLNPKLYVGEDLGEYGDPVDLFQQFFSTQEFKKFYDFDQELCQKLAITLYQICETLPHK